MPTNTISAALNAVIEERERIREEIRSLEAQLNEVDAEIEAVVADALEFARNSPFPEAETANKFIFGEG